MVTVWKRQTVSPHTHWVRNANKELERESASLPYKATDSALQFMLGHFANDLVLEACPLAVRPVYMEHRFFLIFMYCLATFGWSLTNMLSLSSRLGECWVLKIRPRSCQTPELTLWGAATWASSHWRFQGVCDCHRLLFVLQHWEAICFKTQSSTVMVS